MNLKDKCKKQRKHKDKSGNARKCRETEKKTSGADKKNVLRTSPEKVHEMPWRCVNSVRKNQRQIGRDRLICHPQGSAFLVRPYVCYSFLVVSLMSPCAFILVPHFSFDLIACPYMFLVAPSRSILLHWFSFMFSFNCVSSTQNSHLYDLFLIVYPQESH